MDRNLVFLRGNIASDIETLQTKNGKKACRFTLCVNEYNPNSKSGEKNIATFLHLTCFNEYVAKHILSLGRKGSPIDVEGKITVTKLEKNGYTNFYTNILVTDASIIKTKNEEQPNPNDAPDLTNTPF